MLHHLPLEVSQLILEHLDGVDVNNLLSIKQVRARLRDRILLIECDNDPSYIIFSNVFPNIVQRRKLSDMLIGHFSEFKKFLYVVIVSGRTQSLRGTGVQDIVSPKKYYHFIDKCAESCIIDNEVLGRLKYRSTSTDGYCFSSVSDIRLHDVVYPSNVKFPVLRTLSLEKVSFSPQHLDFPCLNSLALVRCESVDVSARWSLPKLKKLSVEGCFKTINDSLDYGTTTISTLVLSGISDMHEWCNFSNSSIRVIDADFDDVIIENIRVELLKQLKLKSKDLQISQMCSPSLEILRIESTMARDPVNVVLSSIDAPKLEVLEAMWANFSQWEDINTPALVTAIVTHSTGPKSNTGFEFMNGILSLWATSCDWWKYTPKVENLTILGAQPNTQSHWQYEFPSLKTLRIEPEWGYLSAFHSSLPHAPKLECLELVGMSNLDFLSTLNTFTHLKKISILQVKGSMSLNRLPNINLEDLYLPSLKTLICHPAYPQSVSIVGCEFPLLLTIQFQGIATVTNYQPPLSRFKMEAPMLKKLTIQGLELGQTFQITKFPNLSELVITGNQGIRNVIIKNCPLLEHLSVSPYVFSCYNTDNKITLYHDYDSVSQFIYFNRSVTFIKQ